MPIGKQNMSISNNAESSFSGNNCVPYHRISLYEEENRRPKRANGATEDCISCKYSTISLFVVQGDTSGCFLGLVVMNTKVEF